MPSFSLSGSISSTRRTKRAQREMSFPDLVNPTQKASAGPLAGCKLGETARVEK